MLKNNYIVEGDNDSKAEELYLLGEQVENLASLAFLVTNAASEPGSVEPLSRAITYEAEVLAEKIKAIALSIGEVGKI